jgi:hypothetical protein
VQYNLTKNGADGFVLSDNCFRTSFSLCMYCCFRSLIMWCLSQTLTESKYIISMLAGLGLVNNDILANSLLVCTSLAR